MKKSWLVSMSKQAVWRFIVILLAAFWSLVVYFVKALYD
jgi:hypothetical protein